MTFTVDKEAKILDIVLREIRAIGQGWRMDWNDFDGRTLRSQINGIAAWAGRARTDPNTPEYTDGTEFLKHQEEGGW